MGPLRLANPPAASRRARRVREVHDRILHAAVERFEQQGVARTKIDEICSLADVAQKTFFNHFPSKQHLVGEIAANFLHELLAILEETRRMPGTTAQRLERFFTRTAAETEAAGPMRRELVMEVIRLVHHDRTDVQQSRRLHAAFGALVRDGVRAGDVTRAHPLPVLTEAVVGAFYTLMLNWLRVDHYPIRTRAAAMARFFAGALGASGRQVHTAKPKEAQRWHNGRAASSSR
ncbi:MAG TPA: TetR/AcrR family transcriptional regulator [Candidatus Margulisiibacteriota bacterium]|nr:TetR/AcrR family transcriptional regulator [Candidatus Margulisiibacteriota bacterium]